MNTTSLINESKGKGKTRIMSLIFIAYLFCGFIFSQGEPLSSYSQPALPADASVRKTIGSGDGRIHIIPSLSAPSVKNDGTLTIQAVVKAVNGVASVKAQIMPAPARAGGSDLPVWQTGAAAAEPAIMDMLTLAPAPANLGGVNAQSTLGIWQADWKAHGLQEGYYAVALTVTDATGHSFTDRSLGFSDPSAGNSTPGTASYPNGGLHSLDAVTLKAGESCLYSAVIDPASGGTGYAYFGTQTVPGIVVKVALGAGANPPTRIGAVTLNAGENYLRSAVIDTAAGYAYFGTDTLPGIVVKIALGSGANPPTRIGALTLNPGENELPAAVIDAAAGYAYFGTGTIPGIVVKVALGAGANPPTRVGAVTLNAGEDSLWSAVIDPASGGTGYAYFGTWTVPGKVVKVALGAGANPPTRVGAVTLNAGENIFRSAVIDAAAGYAYFGTSTAPGIVVKVALGAGANPPTRIGAVTLNAGENNLRAVIDTVAGYAYFGTFTSPGIVVKVALGSGANPPTRVGAVTLNAGEDNLVSAVIDTAAGYAYFGTWTAHGIVVRLGLSQKGFVKATKFSMPEAGALSDVRFYSHESTGTLRLALYDNSATKSLLWQSGAITNGATNSFLSAAISSGTPSSLQLAAGTYWLAWQVDTTRKVPSYAAGSSGDGFFTPFSYGAFPASIGPAALTTTDEVWTEYITYEAISRIGDWQRF